VHEAHDKRSRAAPHASAFIPGSSTIPLTVGPEVSGGYDRTMAADRDSTFRAADGRLHRSHYRERAAPELPGVVEAFWSLEAAGEPRRILPDGCIDFIFDLDRGSARAIGTMSTSRVIASPAGARCFGVRFAPGVAATLLEVRADELSDGDAALDEVSRAGQFRLRERIAEASSHQLRAQLIADFVRTGRARSRPLDRRVQRAIAQLRQRAGALPIASLAQQVGVSERQLERLFQERLGVRPKLFARVLRMQRALQLLEASPTGQAQLALGAGFADEPHLVRDFRALTGRTPAQLLRERRVGFVQLAAAEPR
jgi:AraC-like DNA-binding protein